MSREDQKKRTQKRFIEAIQRLSNGLGACRNRKNLKTAKINIQNVEIEAGLTIGAMKHYQRVKDFIALKKLHPSAVWTDEGDFICADSAMAISTEKVLESKEVAAQRKLNRTRGELQNTKEISDSFRAQHTRTATAMKNQLVAYDCLVSALFAAVPRAKKEDLLKRFETNLQNGNVEIVDFRNNPKDYTDVDEND